MAGKKVNIDITTTANTSGANQSAKALDNLSASANRLNVSNANVASGSKLAGFQVTNLGNQIQDVAVQAQMGTNALTIFAQQGPQIASVFGPQGAVVGALLAVGAIAAQVFMKMGDDTASTEEKAKRLAATIKEIADNAGDIRSEDLDFGRDALQEAIGYTQTLGAEFVAVAQRENDFSKQALDNQELLRQAALDTRRAKGEEINDLDEIAGKSQANAAKLRQEGEAAINVENAKRDAAAQAKQQAQEALNLTTQNFAKQQEQLELDRMRLANLEEEKNRLQELSKQRISVPGAGGPGLGTMPSFASSPGAIDAQKQLETGLIDTQIAAVRAEIDESMMALEGERGKFSEDVRRAGIALGQAALTFEQTDAEVAANIAAITETMAASTVRAEAATLLDTQKALADEINATIKTAVPRTQADAQNIEALKGIASDGLVTANETSQALASLSQLQGVLNTGIGGVNTNVNELITLVRQLQAQTFRQERQIQELKSLQKTPRGIGAGG
jgi:hypothetical protein